ncbi:hypothetical protein ECG_01364 [Echinococcus granulosus]|uniref:Expressed protein n=1 Tax=Echinococcus granulosus TaxID=6210 RepID=A0A068WDP9_ECHGR|nr:hypothetical protein ECG_01364 [Echinococcus granulosus]CDS15721.1 expressed protein [Echinococcus granulosus]
MLETLEPHLVEEIGSSFNQMNEVYVSICECSAGLASLHRRKSRVDKHCIDFGMTVSNDEHLSSYVSARVRACVTLSFGTSVAHGSGKVADLLNLLRLLALRIFSLCESLTSALKKTIAKESCDLSAFNNIVEALTEMTESMVDEIDLVSQWVYSNALPEFVATSVSSPFEFASSCLSDKMLSCTVWREEVYPLLKFTNMFKCF